MDWEHPYYLLLFVPAAAALWWFDRRSLRPLAPARRRMLLGVRLALVGLALLALAGPALQRGGDGQAVIFVLDHSQSQGASGMAAAYAQVKRLAAALPRSAAGRVRLRGPHGDGPPRTRRRRRSAAARRGLAQRDGQQTDLAAAVALGTALFPPSGSKRMVLATDGEQTQGDLAAAAREAALRGVTIDALPVAGEQRPDVRVVRLASNKSCSHEGASFQLRADIESSLAGRGRLRLFENGIEVESRALTLAVGEQTSETFHRAPENRSLYTYTVRAEGFAGDSIPDNNEAMALVDVRGRPMLLYIEGEPEEAHYWPTPWRRRASACRRAAPEAFPQTLQELSGFDSVILSDVPAHKLSERSMAMIRDYVERIGGGFCMIGGKNSLAPAAITARRSKTCCRSK